MVFAFTSSSTREDICAWRERWHQQWKAKQRQLRRRRWAKLWEAGNRVSFHIIRSIIIITFLGIAVYLFVRGEKVPAFVVTGMMLILAHIFKTKP